MWHVLTRSRESLLGLPLLMTVIVLSSRSITSYGPSYGEERGGRTASTLTKTCDAFAMSFSTKMRLFVANLGGTGQYASIIARRF